MNGIAEGLICAPVHTGLKPGKHAGGNNAFSDFAYLAKLRSGDNVAALVHNVEIAVHRIPHLIHKALKQSVRQNNSSLINR